MSAEIRIAFDAERAAGDWVLLDGAELARAPAIETAVLVSLFTDRRALPDDRLEPGEEDRRGWWATALDGKPIGSRLWLLRRAKATAETLKRAKDMMREALQWMIEDGVAARVDVDAEWQARGRIAARITVHRADGTAQTVTAAWAWQGAAA